MTTANGPSKYLLIESILKKNENILLARSKAIMSERYTPEAEAVEQIADAFQDMIESIVDDFGKEEYLMLTEMFNELYKVDQSKRELVLDNLKKDKNKYKFFDQLFMSVKKFIFAFDEEDHEARLSFFYDSLFELIQTISGQSGKEFKQIEKNVTDMLYHVLKDFGLKNKDISPLKILRYAYIAKLSGENDDYYVEVENMGVYNAIWHARYIGIESVFLGLTDDLEVLKNKQDIYLPIIRRLSRVSASLGRDVNKNELYNKYLPLLHEYIQEKLSDPAVKGRYTNNKLIEIFCEQKNKEIFSITTNDDERIKNIQDTLSTISCENMGGSCISNLDSRDRVQSIRKTIPIMRDEIQKDDHYKKENLVGKINKKLDELEIKLNRRLEGIQKDNLISSREMIKKYKEYLNTLSKENSE